MHARWGRDFQQVIDKSGWAALPIFDPHDWGSWWVSRERAKVGLDPAGNPIDLRLPSVAVARDLVERYGLGADYVSDMASLLLGLPPGGGEADIVITPRDDKAGLKVVLNCVRYECTVADWQRIFTEVVQPGLLYDMGKVPTGIPGHEAIALAQKRARSGRPSYPPEKLQADLRMWEFCFNHSYLSMRIPAAAFDKYLNSLPDQERAELEQLDPETFRRNVKALDRLLRPTNSRADFSS